MAGLVGLAVVLGALVGSGSAADEKGVPKDLQAAVEKIATTLETNKAADVKKDAADLKKYDLKYTMRLFKTRKNHGFGVGTAGSVEPDGIERKVEELAENAPPPAQYGKEAAALKQAGLRMAAIAAVAEASAPAKNDGKKKVKDWIQWSADMKAAGLQMAEAKDAASVSKAARAAQTACTKCHDVFRDE
jgi:hypothetical protein